MLYKGDKHSTITIKFWINIVLKSLLLLTIIGKVPFIILDIAIAAKTEITPQINKANKRPLGSFSTLSFL